MLPFRRILFPVDFSEACIGAAHYVEAFAGRFDAELILLHVIEPPNYNDTLADSPTQRRERLESFLVKELTYFRVERIVATGEAASNILNTAIAKNSDLIMMPTHGRGAFRRFLLGSVTAKVLHDADCAVWTGVHMEQAPPLEKIEFHHFACAANLEPHAQTVLQCASEFANEYRASLTIVHASQGSESVADSRQKLEELWRSQGTQATIVVQPGEPAQVVATAAAELHADLLVIGRSAAPGIFGRLRTHAYPIIRQSPCPVISV